MAAIRKNIMSNQATMDKFVEGMAILDETPSGVDTTALNSFVKTTLPSESVFGEDQEFSLYDLFVFWHVFAMSIIVPPANAAHGAPIFLPWHRMYLIRLEQELQRVLNDPDFGLPYWDWAEDGELSSSQQIQTQLWTNSGIGEPRGNVTQGRIGDMRVRLISFNMSGTVQSISPRRIQRNASNSRARTLPKKSHVHSAVAHNQYDVSPWDRTVASHRNLSEGWTGATPPAMHNRVHVWVAGDMGPGTSPNDPVFFLNHCNVDRIWERWMADHGRLYEPMPGTGPAGHRLDDIMVAVLGDPLTPADVLTPSQWYSYDNLSVF
jgi:tyrosinase